MAGIKLFLIAVLGVLCATAASAQTAPVLSFPDWIKGLEQEALSAGISPPTVHNALDNALLDPRVVALDQKQPETTITFEAYSERNLAAAKLDAGHAALLQYGATLNNVAQIYGVPPQIIVALWGMESSFGRNGGNYNVVDSLITLAYQGRRAALFHKELIFALRILDREHLPATALRGSWAGAMGQCQFMPSTYYTYAVDYNRDGIIDIWKNPSDVFASIANYLAAEGWRGGMNWGQEVSAPQNLGTTDIGLDHPLPASQWAQLGIHNIDGSALENSGALLSLIQPDGPTGRSFLVTDNYRAIMRWNRSTYFATTVGLLADRIR